MKLSNIDTKDISSSDRKKTNSSSFSPRLTKDLWDIQLKKDDMTYKYGWLSKILGANEKNVPLYIVAIVSTVLLLFSGLYTLICVKWPQEQFGPKELWSITIPILTSMLGYIFGVGTSKKGED